MRFNGCFNAKNQGNPIENQMKQLFVFLVDLINILNCFTLLVTFLMRVHIWVKIIIYYHDYYYHFDSFICYYFLIMENILNLTIFKKNLNSLSLANHYLLKAALFLYNQSFLSLFLIKNIGI